VEVGYSDQQVEVVEQEEEVCSGQVGERVHQEASLGQNLLKMYLQVMLLQQEATYLQAPVDLLRLGQIVNPVHFLDQSQILRPRNLQLLHQEVEVFLEELQELPQIYQLLVQQVHNYLVSIEIN
jgi:hypothetical protein